MKTFKTLLLFVFIIVTVQYGKAQNGMKEPVSFKLKNGLTVIVAENENHTKVFSNFSIEPAEALNSVKPGVEELLTAILDEAATESNAGITFNEKGANIAALSQDFEKSLTLLSALVKQPAFTQSSFDQQKAKLAASIKAKDRYYAKEITVSAVDALTINDVKDFYRAKVKPADAFLTIAGHITVNDARALVKSTFGEWEETALAANSK